LTLYDLYPIDAKLGPPQYQISDDEARNIRAARAGIPLVRPEAPVVEGTFDPQLAALYRQGLPKPDDPCPAGFVRNGYICLETDLNTERLAAAFKRISVLQHGYVWQYYREPPGRLISVIDVSSPDKSLHLSDVTDTNGSSDEFDFFLQPSGKALFLSGDQASPLLFQILDALSATTLLAVDASDGARLHGLFETDHSRGLQVDVRKFVVEDYGTVEIERLKALSEERETYRLMFPSVGPKGTATMTVTRSGAFLGGLATSPGEPSRKVSASECKHYLSMLNDISPI
jgi:hypothetical protein